MSAGSNKIYRLILSIVLLAAIIVTFAPVLSINQWSLNTIHSGQVDITGPGPADHHRLFLWQGIASLTKGQSDKAVSILEPAFNQSPPDGAVGLSLGRAYLAQGQIEKAKSTWESVGAWSEMISVAEKDIDRRNWQQALDLLQTAQQGLPQEVTTDLARALIGKNEYDLAIKVLKEALSTWTTVKLRQQWLVLLGNSLLQQKNWSEALHYLEQAVSDANDNTSAYAWQAHISYGMALYHGGQGVDKAKFEIEHGIQLQPDKAEGYMALAEIHEKELETLQAEIWYQKAVDHQPNDVWVWVAQVDNLQLHNKNDLALSKLNEALGKFPKEPHLYYLEGVTYRNLNDIQSAILSSQKSVTLDNFNNPKYLSFLSSLYEQAGQFSNSLEGYQKVLTLDSTDQEAEKAIVRLKNRIK